MISEMRGLKIKAPWLELMRLGLKTVEVRSFEPSKFRQPPLEQADSLFLLCNGEVQGMAVYAGLKVYTTAMALKADEKLHALAQGSGPLSWRLQASLAQGKPLYGWMLENFVWFQRWQFMSGCADIPAFKGQKYGQVWSPPLPLNILKHARLLANHPEAPEALTDFDTGRVPLQRIPAEATIKDNVKRYHHVEPMPAILVNKKRKIKENAPALFLDAKKHTVGGETKERSRKRWPSYIFLEQEPGAKRQRARRWSATVLECICARQ